MGAEALATNDVPIEATYARSGVSIWSKIYWKIWTKFIASLVSSRATGTSPDSRCRLRGRCHAAAVSELHRSFIRPSRPVTLGAAAQGTRLHCCEASAGTAARPPREALIQSGVRSRWPGSFRHVRRIRSRSAGCPAYHTRPCTALQLDSLGARHGRHEGKKGQGSQGRLHRARTPRVASAHDRAFVM